MGDIINPVSGNSFVELVEARHTRIFVDKTDFIDRTNALLNTDGKLLALTRPRRFGKTIAADMLLAYYSKGSDGQRIFKELKIAQKDSYSKHLNKYDVIYIDMNSVRDDYISYMADEELKVNGIETIVDYLQYSIIEELRENEIFSELLANSSKVGKKNLATALKTICDGTKDKFILIMDEWDLIYREYRDDIKLQESFIDLLRGLFKGKKGQSSFALVYLTGILPIKKYNSQSALNGFDEYNMLAPGDFAPYFGFTEDEVAEIVKSLNCKVSHQELKDWYEGYKFKGIDIYNPNSVSKAVARNECISYWSGTSSNEEVVRLINMDFDGIKEDIVNMIEDGKSTFCSAKFQNDMVSINNKNDAFSLLVCLGYLCCSEADEDGYRQAYVPNKEIKNALKAIVKDQDWLERMETVRRSEQLLKSMLELDEPMAAKLIQDVHNSPAVSLLDYNDEESLTYCVMTGLMWSTLGKYICHREEQAGKGRADLVYEPRNGTLPLILIEFKHDSSAEDAIAQIKTKEYFKRYEGQYKNIVLVGINYSTKMKEHQCKIEKLS